MRLRPIARLTARGCPTLRGEEHLLEGENLRGKLLVSLLILCLSAIAAFVVIDRSPEDDRFHSDYARVFNGFQSAASDLLGNGGAGSVAPDSDCRQLDASTWRCYRRWAPIERPTAVKVLEAEVSVYDDRVVVGRISRRPD
jgi:hypothetical protein